MHAMVLTAEVRARVAAIRAHAAAHVLPLARVWRLAHGEEQGIAMDDDNSLLVPVGFRVSYGIEEQQVGLVAHLGVSIQEPGACPHPVAVQMLLAEFGMPGLEACDAVFPRKQDNGLTVINVLARLPQEAQP